MYSADASFSEGTRLFARPLLLLQPREIAASALQSVRWVRRETVSAYWLFLFEVYVCLKCMCVNVGVAVVLSLNGRRVYRSAVAAFGGEGRRRKEGSPLRGEGCAVGLWDERIELQIHHPFSVLLVEVFDKDATEGVAGGDELVGFFEVQLKLLRPAHVLDIT